MKNPEKEIPTRIVAEFPDVVIMFIPAGVPVDIDNYLFPLTEPVLLKVEMETGGFPTRVVAVKGLPVNPASEKEARQLMAGVTLDEITCSEFADSLIAVTTDSCSPYNTLNVGVAEMIWPIFNELTLSRLEYLDLVKDKNPLVVRMSRPYVIIDGSMASVAVVRDYTSDSGAKHSTICFIHNREFTRLDVSSEYICYCVTPDEEADGYE